MVRQSGFGIVQERELLTMREEWVHWEVLREGRGEDGGEGGRVVDVYLETSQHAHSKIHWAAAGGGGGLLALRVAWV